MSPLPATTTASSGDPSPLSAEPERRGGDGPTSSAAAGFRSWPRWVLGLGPVSLAALFLLRATTPVIDTTLVGIFVVLVACTVALIGGSRVGAAGVLMLGLALFQPITAREFSFSLSAIDSDGWRIWAIASLVALGWSLVAAVIVLVSGRRSDSIPRLRLASAAAGGVVLGVALIAVFPALSPQAAFGQDLDADAIAALPVIEMRNYGYAPAVVQVTSAGTYRARVTNPSNLPHTLTIESLDIEVFVPAGRWAVLELEADDLVDAPLSMICTIGDHLSLGMAGVIELD
ncbi:MAG TPA: hypothetical protein VES40_06470 [Ilumatobacteraceae bacterium]|nr:hypothetical protein [Ilumatobacteraceae bacterium]